VQEEKEEEEVDGKALGLEVNKMQRGEVASETRGSAGRREAQRDGKYCASAGWETISAAGSENRVRRGRGRD